MATGQADQRRGTARSMAALDALHDRLVNPSDGRVERARAALVRVIEVVPHTDADGLAAGAIVLRELGRPADDALLLGRGQTPWSPDVQLAMPALLDWGVRERPGPALVIDHHAPEATPRPDQVVLSGRGADPELSTSVFAGRVCPGQPAWLATVGAFGDLGDRAFALPEAGGVPKTAIRRLVPLLNAPRRGPDGAAIRTALALLVEHDDPKAILADSRIAELQEARDAWQAAGSRCGGPRRGSARAQRSCASARGFSCTRSPRRCGLGAWHRAR